MKSSAISTFSVAGHVTNLTDPPTITCTPSNIVGTETDSLVVFSLQDKKGEFVFPATNAITVEDGGSEFPNLWRLDGTHVALHDLCGSAAEYEYTVTVEEASTGKLYALDPKITNEPG